MDHSITYDVECLALTSMILTPTHGTRYGGKLSQPRPGDLLPHSLLWLFHDHPRPSSQGVLAYHENVLSAICWRISPIRKNQIDATTRMPRRLDKFRLLYALLAVPEVLYRVTYGPLALLARARPSHRSAPGLCAIPRTQSR